MSQPASDSSEPRLWRLPFSSFTTSSSQNKDWEVGLKREELLLVTATRAHTLYGRKKVIFLKENFFLLYVFNMSWCVVSVKNNIYSPQKWPSVSDDLEPWEYEQWGGSATRHFSFLLAILLHLPAELLRKFCFWKPKRLFPCWAPAFSLFRAPLLGPCGAEKDPSHWQWPSSGTASFKGRLH